MINSKLRIRALVRSTAAVVKPWWTLANEFALGIHTISELPREERAAPRREWWRGEHSDDARYDDNHHYATIDYWNLRRVLRELRPGKVDVFYDIGCGMGRILCCAARRPLKKCVGIELFEPLCEIARENSRRLRGRKAPIEIRCADAAKADLSEGTVYWLFNPFGERTLMDTLRNIEDSIKRNPRKITIVYYNPTCEHVLTNAGWLQKVRESRAPGGNAITFWRNCEAMQIGAERTEVEVHVL